jgi:hypothetical protein
MIFKTEAVSDHEALPSPSSSPPPSPSPLLGTDAHPKIQIHQMQAKKQNMPKQRTLFTTLGFAPFPISILTILAFPS